MVGLYFNESINRPLKINKKVVRFCVKVHAPIIAKTASQVQKKLLEEM